MLATDEGRSQFWAESAVRTDEQIEWRFPNGLAGCTKIVREIPPRTFALEYLGGSTATFNLASDGAGGTDLTLTDVGVPEENSAETLAGWVSVLMALKAAADFGVDLRNHDPERTWDQGFVDN